MFLNVACNRNILAVDGYLFLNFCFSTSFGTEVYIYVEVEHIYTWFLVDLISNSYLLKCISATFLTYRVCFLIAAMDIHKQEHFTGIYDLVSVLTHKGRSADSGHYVAWVKQENCELHQILSNCVILSEVCQLLVLIPLKIRL